jgi:transcriptional regulator with XRE-family HTH domain
MNIGDRLKFLRTRLNMSVEQAAELSGYSPAQIKKIEHGYSPPVACLEAVLAAYGHTVAEFFESPAIAVHKDDRVIFEMLRFIFEEARRPEATTEQKKRASAIAENVHEFYQNAIRSSKPRPGKKARSDESVPKIAATSKLA